MGISFDFTNRDLLQQSDDQQQVKKYTFRDIGTSRIVLKEDQMTGKQYLNDIDTSVTDINAVKTALNNIFAFRPGESILMPEFGIGTLYEYLYSPMDKYLVQKITRTIKDIISLWEPRVRITSIPIEYDDITIKFTIYYDIPELNVSDSYEYVFKK